MMSVMRVLAVTFATVLLLACGRSAEPAFEGGGRLQVSVAALSYDAVTDVSWGLAVYSGDPESGGELVVSRPDLRSARFGNGSGSFSYVAPCDAQTGTAFVRLTLNALYTGTGELIDPATWQNPTPLTQEVTCVENADTPVTFNITLMRSAQQGFFDIGVSFSGTFCSAKFDCLGDDEQPLELLHDPATGERAATMVLGFACTSGNGKETYLHMSDVHVACFDGASTTPYWVSPVGTQGGAEGNQGEVLPLFFQTALYQGQEALPDVDKCYWNLAFGVADGAPPNCRLVVDATASEVSWQGTGGAVPDGAIYPYIHFEIPITGSEGELQCGRHPLNGADQRVVTRYTGPTSGAFPFEWACGAETPVPDELGRVQCAANVTSVGPTTATFTQSPSGVSVSFGASRGQAYRMPGDLRLDDCCLNPCCTE